MLMKTDNNKNPKACHFEVLNRQRLTPQLCHFDSCGEIHLSTTLPAMIYMGLYSNFGLYLVLMSDTTLREDMEGLIGVIKCTTLVCGIFMLSNLAAALELELSCTHSSSFQTNMPCPLDGMCHSCSKTLVRSPSQSKSWFQGHRVDLLWLRFGLFVHL